MSIEYRPIPGAPGYSINREGEVIGRRGRRLATSRDPRGGGPKVNIDFEGRHTSKNLAGLVALAWAPEPERPSGLDIEALRRRIEAAEAVVFGKTREQAA